MLYLSKPSLDYAITMCTTRPRYQVIIVLPPLEESRAVFNDIIQALENSECHRIIGHIGCKNAEWQNGSVLTITTNYNNARGRRVHLLIADENVSDDIIYYMEPLETLELIDRTRREERISFTDIYGTDWLSSFHFQE